MNKGRAKGNGSGVWHLYFGSEVKMRKFENDIGDVSNVPDCLGDFGKLFWKTGSVGWL